VTAAHLDHDALADLAEGILDEDTAASAEAHLADCADCRDRAAEVAEVSRVLAEAPMPPMPTHLVERLDAAIAAEAASNMSAHRRPRRFQILAAAAAAVVVAVGGGTVIARTVLNDGASKSTAISQPPVDEPSRPHAPDARAQALRPVPYSAVQSGTKYTKANLAAQVASLLTASPSAGRLLATPTGPLDGCVRRISAGKVPLLVDSATYDGVRATIIALPAADIHQADVWIVGPDCSMTDSDLISHALISR
jgi:anti-sigma factor RsiW